MENNNNRNINRWETNWFVHRVLATNLNHRHSYCTHTEKERERERERERESKRNRSFVNNVASRSDMGSALRPYSIGQYNDPVDHS